MLFTRSFSSTRYVLWAKLTKCELFCSGDSASTESVPTRFSLCKFLPQRLTPVMKNISPLQSRLPSSSASAVTLVSPLVHSWPLGPSPTPQAAKRSLRYTLRVQAILSPAWNRSRFLWSLGQRMKKGKMYLQSVHLTSLSIFSLSTLYTWPRLKTLVIFKIVKIKHLCLKLL